MDKLGFWNIRGLNKASKLCDVLWFIRHHGVGLFGLLETKVKVGKFGDVFNRLGSDWSVCANYPYHKGGRIWVVWLSQFFDVIVVRCEVQLIHVYVAHKATGLSFDCTKVYGLNTAGARVQLWEQIIELSNKITGPWILQGDFNSVLNLKDRIGSNVSLVEVKPFRSCLRSAGLTDWATGGMFYTWNNKQEGKDRVCSKIDRVIVNNEWMLKFADIEVTFFPEGLMDHSPCVINLFDSGNHTKKPFRFVNIWVESPEFLPGVKDVWCKMISGTPIFQCVRKLKEVKQFLKESKMGRFSCVEVDDAIAEKHLEDIQIKLQSDPGNEELISQERLARIQFSKTHSDRFNFLKQKAKVHWLKDGDMNTTFFHAMIRKRRLQNNIYSIVTDEGVVISDPGQVYDAFL
ncbi:uncharacterized protein LOC110701666 [Chenopodium quinoa]|uniref:uncharacterized protein LOC110701666 n=1 Tax=Chenopodium quinoa TaxID=63459 RepID=UPI000B77A7FB|nr:uncharacterized protein LOC110701666 [Chenopodium quinoa]